MSEKLCPRCIEDYEDDTGELQKGTEEPSDCKHCGICADCEHLAECPESDNEPETCAECQRTVPFGFLNPLMTSTGVSADICPVCALRITNLMHGIQRDKFQGTMAEEMRRATIQHYKDTNQKHDYGN